MWGMDTLKELKVMTHLWPITCSSVYLLPMAVARVVGRWGRVASWQVALVPVAAFFALLRYILCLMVFPVPPDAWNFLSLCEALAFFRIVIQHVYNNS